MGQLEEGDLGVAEEPGADQREVPDGGDRMAAIVLVDDEGSGCQWSLSDECLQGGEGVFAEVGRVGEDEVEGGHGGEQANGGGQGSADDGGATEEVESADVVVDGFEGRAVALDEGCVGGAAGDGFEAEGTGAGEEVEDAALREGEVEACVDKMFHERLSDPPGRGSGVEAGGGDDESATE